MSSNQAAIILPHGEKERVNDTGTDDGWWEGEG